MPPTDEDDFAALLEASEGAGKGPARITVGDVVRGRVVGLSATKAFVDLGSGREAAIDVGEFRDAESGAISLGEGDEVEATVVDDGGTSGTILLKRVAGRGGHLPGELEQAFEHGVPIEGLVSGENKGGFDVQIGSVRAFCPGSQIDRRRGDAASYVGQRFQFRITKLEQRGRNVVVSRRQLLEAEAAEQGAATWARLEEGAVVHGTVTSIRDFGAFVDIGGIDGLIHVSELGHARVDDPAAVVQVGQEVDVKVVKLEPASGGKQGRVGLSLKALAPDPWSTVGERFPVGTSVGGTVRRLEQFGAFVELAPGIDGLVHVSQMALDRRVAHPRQVVSIGDAVVVTVLKLDLDKHRISLSMVEHARQARDAADAEARRETDEYVAKSSAAATLGTFGDLLKPKS